MKFEEHLYLDPSRGTNVENIMVCGMGGSEMGG